MIPASVRERLAIASAEYNNCAYGLSAETCIGAHVAKVDAGVLERARHAESADPRTAALPAPSDAIARGRGSIDGTQLRTARAADVTDAEMAGIVGSRALNILTNYFNVLADTDNAWPVVTPHTHD